jgi:hypothetical protein
MYASAAVGTISTFAGLGLSSLLDSTVSLNISNIVGLVFESVIDYFGQKMVFAPTNSTKVGFRGGRFLVGKIGAIGITQVTFMGLMWLLGKKNQKKVLDVQLLRLAAAAIAWIPHFILRKYWIFA